MSDASKTLPKIHCFNQTSNSRLRFGVNLFFVKFCATFTVDLKVPPCAVSEIQSALPRNLQIMIPDDQNSRTRVCVSFGCQMCDQGHWYVQ